MIDTPTTTSDWLVAFCHRYDKTRKSRDDVTTRKSRRTKFNIMNRFHVRAAEEKRMRLERVRDGYVFPFAREIAGRVRQPFVEKGLRTLGNPILKLFVAQIPRGGKARASDNKSELYVPYWSKMLTLDCPYIEGNKKFLSFIRLDCDAVFTSAEACVVVLQERVEAGAIPHLPHIIVGDELPNGNFANPHFLFMLEVGVWNNEKDARCRQTPIRLFEAVSRGLTSALLDIGVDPGAPQGTLRCKNPISPIWRTMTPNAEHFMSLKEYASALRDMKSTRPDLIRRAAELQSGMGKLKSNELFNKLLDFGVKLLANWHYSRDERMRLPVEELGNAVYDSMAAYVSSSRLSEERAAYVIEKVATHLAVSFNPKKLDKPRARKRLAHIVEGMTTVEDRQRAGAVYAHGARNKKSLDTLKATVVDLRDAGKLAGMSKETISIRSGVSRAFVYKHLDKILQEIAV